MGKPFFAFLVVADSFSTEWMAANHFARTPVAVYGFILLMSGVAYRLLAGILASHCGRNSELSQALGDDWKGKLSTIINIIAIITTWCLPVLACVLYAIVAVIWFAPEV